MKRCNRCGAMSDDSATFCSSCGARFAPPQYKVDPEPEAYNRDNPFDSCGPEGKSRGVCALLAIFLGGFGIQYFYLGKISAGILSIIITLCTCGIWEAVTLIQGIIMLAGMTNTQFRRKYVTNTSAFPLF